jgi:hypothetical protein
MDQAKAQRDEARPSLRNPNPRHAVNKASLPPSHACDNRPTSLRRKAPTCISLLRNTGNEPATNQIHLQHPATPANFCAINPMAGSNLLTGGSVTVATTHRQHQSGPRKTRTRGGASLRAHHVWNFASSTRLDKRRWKRQTGLGQRKRWKLWTVGTVLSYLPCVEKRDLHHNSWCPAACCAGSLLHEVNGGFYKEESMAFCIDLFQTLQTIHQISLAAVMAFEQK